MHVCYECKHVHVHVNVHVDVDREHSMVAVGQHMLLL